MNPHLTMILDAYLDGELSPEQARAAEQHLQGCPACRQALASRQALAGLLAEAPAACPAKPEARFLAEVGLRLERRPAPRPAAGLGETAWRLIPIGLLLVVIFIQAIAIVSTLVGWIPGAEQALLGSAPRLGATALPGPLGVLLRWMDGFSLFRWNNLTSLAALLGASLMYLGWLASWFARNQPTAQNRG